MRKSYFILFVCAFLGLFLISNSSCQRKTGCPVNERAHVKTNKKGELPTKRGRSSVIPPGMKKKKRKN